MPRGLGLLAAAALTATSLIPSAPVTARTSRASADAGWVLSTSEFSNDYTRAPYVGNGYIGQRITGAGMGFHAGFQSLNTWPTFYPRITTAIASGVYGTTPSAYGNLQAIATLPAWTTLNFDSPSGTYSAGTASADQITDYSKSLELRTGTVTTSGTWTAPGGEKARFAYRVFTDRARKHMGVVTLDLTPMWSGVATVAGLLEGAVARRLDPVDVGVDTATHTSYVTSRSTGVGMPVAESAVLVPSPNVTPTADLPVPGLPAQSAGERVVFPVESGKTYSFTKYVAVVTGRDSRDPAGDARAESQHAASLGLARLESENSDAWGAIWRSDILVDGDPALQRAIRASEYSLYASLRSDSPSSIGPSGLGGEGYAGLVFWDAETWMFPALLAQHPDIARAMVDYRFNTLDAARRNAIENGYKGAFYPWTSAYDGNFDSNCYGVVHAGNQVYDSNKSCTQELHLQGDIGLAQWQYYEATGDMTWLATRGWPVMEGIAGFWASKASPTGNGGYSIGNVQPPDEYATGVNNSSYTNAVAALALERASRAARLVGKSAPATWMKIAAGLKKTMPYDGKRRLYLEYEGYDGGSIKQADTVMLTYPVEFPMPFQVGVNGLNYYAPRTDPSGPAMTDSIHSIDASALDVPGCSAYTYLLRAHKPFLRDPYLEFSEVRRPDVVTSFSFLTGAGGFLQSFLYGFTGFRMRPDSIRVDPSLSPQLKGITLQNMRWQGRTFTVKIGSRTTTVSLASGPALRVGTPSGVRTLKPGGTLAIPTRRPDLQPTDNLARCTDATASSFIPGNDPVAAVDGSPATPWIPASNSSEQWLAVDLARTEPVREITVTRGSTDEFSYSVQTSRDGKTWSTVGSAPSTSTSTDKISIKPTSARFVRLVFPSTSFVTVPAVPYVNSSPSGVSIAEISVVSGKRTGPPLGKPASTRPLPATGTGSGSAGAVLLLAALLMARISLAGRRAGA